MKTRKHNRRARGTSLIEAMIAIAVLLIGMAGFASLQVISVRANHFAKSIAAASSLATDMAENVSRWLYTDTRLAPPRPAITACTLGTLQTCFNDTDILTRWDMGSNVSPAYTPDFDDTQFGTTWDGVPVTSVSTPSPLSGADVDRDNIPEYFRYWNVHLVDPAGTGTPLGVLVQVVVRWKEPAFGYRQVSATSFKLNPAGLAL